MTCDEEALTEYLDGELSPERCAVVEAHVKDCASCRATLEKLKAGSTAFRAHGHVDVPVGLEKAAFPDKGRDTAGRERPWVPALVVASLTAVVFVSGKLLKPQVSGIFNQAMGMISGAASTVGDGGGMGTPVGGDAGSSLLSLLLVGGAVAGVAAALVYLWKRRRR
ncbi:MAG: zf-HC2 domain-containing protein [Elusimicrobia bacterium]|nr:zf-HC2 domain-containing protein [Elusimicrobiota bacterium]